MAYNVCVPQLLAAVNRQQHLREGINAIGLRHTTFGKRPPGTRQGIVLRVGKYPTNHPDRSLAGQPCLESNGNIIGAFPQHQKVPIVGTAFRSPQFTLKANQQGVVNYAKGDVEQTSIYVPIKSSKETEGLVDEQMPASVKAVRVAREASNSGFPYKPVKDIEPPTKVRQHTRSRKQAQPSKPAPTTARSEMQMG